MLCNIIQLTIILRCLSISSSILSLMLLPGHASSNRPSFPRNFRPLGASRSFQVSLKTWEVYGLRYYSYIMILFQIFEKCVYRIELPSCSSLKESFSIALGWAWEASASCAAHTRAPRGTSSPRWARPEPVCIPRRCLARKEKSLMIYIRS